MTNKKPLGYLGGDIMSYGSNLARQAEYDKFKELELPVEVYSPVMNKSINDKSNMTEEENNHLAEKITAADIERLWNSDFVVMSPEQSAIGSLCETGCLFGWKYMSNQLLDIIKECDETCSSDTEKYVKLKHEIQRINRKKDFFHYFDIRTNHLNEKDWRRSFSINQLLYGMILYTAENGDFESFDEIMQHLVDLYKPNPENQLTEDDTTWIEIKNSFENIFQSFEPQSEIYQFYRKIFDELLADEKMRYEYIHQYQKLIGAFQCCME